MNLYVIYILLLFSCLHANDAQSICRGQDFTLDHTNVSMMLSQLRQYFSNCEYIYDNLEIRFPQLTEIPGQFSDVFVSIREIQGYLLLENIRTDTLNMSNLLIIRGQYNFTVNNTPNALVLKNTQINTLLLTNLKEITNFGVTVYNENQNISSACNLHGVNWADILNTSSVFLSPNCTTQSCAVCTPSYCWTETDCQMLTLINCTCNGGRCVSNNQTECCDVTLCSAGCTASSTCNACSGCRRFDSGISTCIQQSMCIPSGSIRGYRFLTPPFLSATCSTPLIVETQGLIEFCSRQCGEFNAQSNTLCINGAGTDSLLCRPCQSPQGEGECIPYPTSSVELPALNVPSIPKSTCPTITTINSIVLDQGSFDPVNPITPSLLNVFGDLTVISDYLVIRDFPSYYGDAFTFLSRLTRIGGAGNTLYMGRYSLHITNNAFRQIDLRSLSAIASGDVLIENNTNLCYLPTVSGFTSLITDMSQNVRVQSPSCPCHSLCESSMGCWGPSNAQCIECSVVEIDEICETNCESRPNTYISSKRCEQCDPLCINCTGSATNCTECRNVRSLDGECLASCPSTTFLNGSDCIPCSLNCKTNEVNGPICSGPTNNFGLAFNGCSECTIYQPQNNTLANYTCVLECVNSFADGTLIPGPVCRPCDPACTRCTGATVQDCDRSACSVFLDEETTDCVLNCSNVTHYVSAPRTCTLCDPICNGCTGASNRDCINCLGSIRGDECVSSCPSAEFTNSSRQCEACNDLCGSCMGTRDNCITCRLAMIIMNGTRTCLSECPPGYYRATNLTCLLCNTECFNCSGALDTDCVGRCRNFQLLPADQCVSVCPATAEVNNATKTCTITSSSLNAGVIAGISVGATIFLLIVVGVIVMIIVGGVYSRKHKKKNRDKLEQGTLLHLKEKGNIQRTIEGLPEFTLLGFNYETLAEATPSVFPLHVINKSALEVRKLLGRGFYGTVYAGHYNEHSHDGFPVAIKNLNENGLKSNSENELAIAMQDISRLMHPSLVQVFGYNSSRNSPFIVTQLLIGPSLYNLFSRYPGCIDEDKIFKYIIQIGDGMMYLEKQGFVYGLVTARNVILENYDKIKLTDFFLHRFSEPVPDNALDLPIQERWMSPELALTHNPTNKSDVWGFGVLFWELLSFVQLPYDKVPDDAVVGVLQQGQRLPQPTACSVDLYGYLLQCFLFEPSGRPTFEKLQTELVEMSKLPQKFISIQLDKLDSTMANRLEHSRVPKATTLVIGNPSTHSTLTQQDITTEELGLGEYVDEEVVNKLIDSESELIQQDKTTEELGLGEYVDEDQVNKLIDAASIDQLISNSGEYGEINQASSEGKAIENEYAEVDIIPKELSHVPGIDLMQESEFPNFVSIHNTQNSTVDTPNKNNIKVPISSLEVTTPTDDASPYEQPTVFISPSTSFFSPYESVGQQNANK